MGGIKKVIERTAKPILNPQPDDILSLTMSDTVHLMIIIKEENNSVPHLDKCWKVVGEIFKLYKGRQSRSSIFKLMIRDSKIYGAPGVVGVLKE